MNRETLPEWYWSHGLHDAELIEVTMEDDTLILRLDSRSVIMQDDLHEIRFHVCRLKTPLPQPSRGCRIYWMGDTLTPLPYGQWKLNVTFSVYPRGCATEKQNLTVIFEAAETA